MNASSAGTRFAGLFVALGITGYRSLNMTSQVWGDIVLVFVDAGQYAYLLLGL